MNLKEAFRYQKFLDRMLYSACASIQKEEHCLRVTKTHLKSTVNPEASDVDEVIEVEPFVSNDITIAFIEWLIDQKESLSIAIGNAKKSLPCDIDASIEANKYRQKAASAIDYMLKRKPRKRQTTDTDYKFNVEGNQSAYYYKVDIIEEELFDRVANKHIERELLSKAEEVSAEVDSYMTNTPVDYTPIYSVTESYDDVISEFSEAIN